MVVQFARWIFFLSALMHGMRQRAKRKLFIFVDRISSRHFRVTAGCSTLFSLRVWDVRFARMVNFPELHVCWLANDHGLRETDRVTITTKEAK